MFVGRRTCMNGCGNSDSAQEYVYVDGSIICAMVRIMVRGGSLPVRGSTRMTWKYDEIHCVCGDVESEKHVLLDCNLYVDVRRRRKEKMDAEHADMYEDIQGYEVNNECIEKEPMCYMSMVWSARQRSELSRLVEGTYGVIVNRSHHV